MNNAQRHEKVMRFLRRRNRYQFGQPKSDRVADGAVACTDTSIQHVVKLARDLNVSLNRVRDVSGAPNDTPMDVDEALRALRFYGLPYEIRRGIHASEVCRIARQRGPVLIAYRYWSGPQWKGYTYLGQTLKGWAKNDVGKRVYVGFARPLSRAGLTQTTFRDGHSAYIATDMWIEGTHYAVMRDHNHNSASRPERPAYDLITMPQLNRMLRSWPGESLALVPTRPVIR